MHGINEWSIVYIDGIMNHNRIEFRGYINHPNNKNIRLYVYKEDSPIFNVEIEHRTFKELIETLMKIVGT